MFQEIWDLAKDNLTAEEMKISYQPQTFKEKPPVTWQNIGTNKIFCRNCGIWLRQSNKRGD
jgi:hypothetical protein